MPLERKRTLNINGVLFSRNSVILCVNVLLIISIIFYFIFLLALVAIDTLLKKKKAKGGSENNRYDVKQIFS